MLWWVSSLTSPLYDRASGARYATRMRTRREGVLFTVVVTLAMLVGAGLIGLVLLGQGAPGAVVIGTLLAAVPVAPLIGCYLWLDRYEPEPRSLLVLGLGWGAFVATSAALLLQLFDYFVADSTRV